MAHRFLLAAAALIAAGLAPSRSEAQSWLQSWELCTTAYFSSCHSVSVQTHAIMSGSSRVGTAISISLHNFQGQGYPFDNTLSSGLGNVLLARAGQGGWGASSGTATGVAAGGATGTATWDWWTYHSVTGRGPNEYVSVRAPNYGSGQGFVGGCGTLPLAFGIQTPTRTCAPNSTWTLTFSIAFNVDAYEFDGVLLHAVSTTFDTFCARNFAAFDLGTECQMVDGSVTQLNVVPEPMTVALLGTGLVGVGGARLRRRKKYDNAG